MDKFRTRIVLIHLIARLSYEFVKYSSKRLHNPIVKGIAVPGLWLASLTTGRPRRDQVEVAIRAIEEVLSRSGSAAGMERAGNAVR